MKFKISRSAEDIVVYQPGKPVEELERELGISESIKLASNENPLGPSPKGLEAVRKALSGVHRYPDGGGFYLKRRLAEFHGMAPENFTIGNGTNEVLESIAHAFLDPGDPVVFSEGAFIVYLIVSQLSNCEIRTAPMRDYTHDLEAMAGLVCERTKAVFIANPNNPTGTAVGEGALRRFIETLSGETLVVVDEAYIDFSGVTALPLVSDHANLVVTRTFSKAFALAGFRLGYAVMSVDLATEVQKCLLPFNIDMPSAVAGEVLLDHADFVAERARTVVRERDWLIDSLNDLPRVKAWPSHANFFLLETSARSAATFDGLTRRGILVRDVSSYPLCGNVVRVTVGTPEENQKLLEGVRALL